MKPRDLILMKSLIESYVREGNPVGSKTLLQSSHLKVSPATVRNIMSELEKQGLVLSPHTSAGRIPTTQGFRIFVDQLIQVQNLSELTLQKMKLSLNPAQETQTILSKASLILSEMTQMASLVQIPSKPLQKLQHLEFVPLSDNKLLVILVLDGDEIQNRIIRLDKNFRRDELLSMAELLNQLIVGKDLTQARQTLLAQLINEKQKLDDLTKQAIWLAEQGMANLVSQPQEQGYHLAGQANLVSLASHGLIDNLETIFQAFKQKQQMMNILDRSMLADGVKIFIGEEIGSQSLQNCSIISAPYQRNGEAVGVLAVIGPTRMQYDKVIPIVDVTAKLLSSALTEKKLNA